MLSIRELTKSFGENRAIDHVSFDVPVGMTGFVGGNGAGKTTTMRSIMGTVFPDSGEILWHGEPVNASHRRRFGYMPEERGLYPRQKVLEQIVYFGRLLGRSASEAKRDGEALLERFGLADRAGDMLDSLSLGNQQRVQVVVAVISQPDFLILDEPFSGLDPDAVDEMATLLQEYAMRGVPVLFSSHQLELVERLCDRLTILSQGRVVATGTREELQRRAAIRHRLHMNVDAGWVRELQLPLLDIDGPTAIFDELDPAQRDALLNEALNHGSVLEFNQIAPSLTDIYREVSR